MVFLGPFFRNRFASEKDTGPWLFSFGWTYPHSLVLILCADHGKIKY